MAETLGSLLDKLAVLKIRQWHADHPDVISSLKMQELDLHEEIEDFIVGAASGRIPPGKLTCQAHKSRASLIFVDTSISELFSRLALVNCDIWDGVDKSHPDSGSVDDHELAIIAKHLARQNLERNRYKEAIDEEFSKLCKKAIAASAAVASVRL